MRLFVLSLLFFTPAIGQVRVDVRMDQTEYLAGEPVFAVVQITNTGTKPVGFSLCLGQVDLKVKGEAQSLCEKASADSACSGIPPTIETGESVEFWYLLKGYRLGPGEYVLHASGHAGVTPAAPVDTELRFAVHSSTSQELSARYAGWIAAARDEKSERHALARDVMLELARECRPGIGASSGSR
jgi:hypothetical protein